MPADGAANVAGNATMQATFNEAMLASSIGTATFELRQGGATGTLLTRSVNYNATTRVATLTPSARLVGGQSYTAIVKGGSAGVKNAAGSDVWITTGLLCSPQRRQIGSSFGSSTVMSRPSA